MFAVVVTEKGGEQRRYEFDKNEVTIGRVQGNDVIMPKGNVSKRHSRIVVKDGKFIIVDLKSTNGTYVNGRKITSPLVIKPSDRIYIGDFILHIDDGSEAAAEAGGPPPPPPGQAAGGPPPRRSQPPPRRAQSGDQQQAPPPRRRGLFQWDVVVNEPYQNDDITDILGNDVMVRWFQDARAADPDCQLFINENGIFSGPNEAKRTFYRNLVQYLLDKGAPLDGIGMQGNFSNTPVGMTEFLRRINIYGKFNKQIEITEFDFFAENDNVQADYIRDALKMFYSYPLTTGFIFWGFYEDSMAKPNAAIVNEDWTNKPAAETLKDLTRNQRWTNVSGTTSADGIYSTRGFLGDYSITLTSGSENIVLNDVLDREGLYMKVRFDGNAFTLLNSSKILKM